MAQSVSIGTQVFGVLQGIPAVACPLVEIDMGFQMQATAVFCEVRYVLDPERLDEFREYGLAWVRLIERHGGIHHGFFLPRAAPSDASISYPGKGNTGPEGVAVALYGFPDEETYNRYRANIPQDPEAQPILERFAEPPFRSYERIFLLPLTPAG